MISVVLQVGAAAPDFELPSDSGERVRLSFFRGKRVVLYFYPEDDTPGCTTQAQGFQSVLKDIGGKNAVVLGVSPDPVDRHRLFKTKYGLKFPLLADVDHAVASAYGAWGPKQMFGNHYEGIFRTTFVIDEQGRIAKVFEKVNPEGHCDVVLGAL